VYEPADGIDLALALAEASDGAGPAYLRLRRYGMPAAIGDAEPHGPARQVHDGGPAALGTVVVVGNLLEEALTAVRILEDEGVPLDLVHVVRIKPLELAPIVASANRTGRAIVIENHVAAGGGAQAVTAATAAFGIRTALLTLPHRFLPAGDPRWLLGEVGLDANSMAERIAAELIPEAA
jgi:transketolase